MENVSVKSEGKMRERETTGKGNREGTRHRNGDKSRNEAVVGHTRVTADVPVTRTVCRANEMWQQQQQ